MRLSVFSPEKSSQLFIDLAKIYQNYLPAEQLTEESLQALIENEHAQFYVTMFNGRHLGAVQATVIEDQAFLKLLAVRELTQRRGVATNLLNEVEKQLKIQNVNEIKMDLRDFKEQEREGVTLFMQACGYNLIDSIFRKVL